MINQNDAFMNLEIVVLKQNEKKFTNWYDETDR